MPNSLSLGEHGANITYNPLNKLHFTGMHDENGIISVSGDNCLFHKHLHRPTWLIRANILNQYLPMYLLYAGQGPSAAGGATTIGQH